MVFEDALLPLIGSFDCFSLVLVDASDVVFQIKAVQQEIPKCSIVGHLLHIVIS